MKDSLVPESPRWLVSQDRDDEALAILVKYHAEGDADSLLVKAEMEQIRSTIKLEMESAKQSWWSIVSKPGMRRRAIVSVFLGLFTQLSGNSLLSYYSSLLFEMMGYTTSFAKTRINIANQCWALLTAVVIAIFVTRFKRRLAFMTSAFLMLCVFIGMTVSFYNLQVAKDAKTTNSAAGIAALFFYFSFQPTYNIGNNALTYSKSTTSGSVFHKGLWLIFSPFYSLSARTLAIRTTKSRYRYPTDVWKVRPFLLQQRQPVGLERDRLEIYGHLLWLDRLRIHHRVPPLP